MEKSPIKLCFWSIHPDMLPILRETFSLLLIGSFSIVFSLFLIVEGWTCHCLGYSHIRNTCHSCIILDIDDPPCEPGLAWEPFLGAVSLFTGVLVLSEWKYHFDTKRREIT